MSEINKKTMKLKFYDESISGAIPSAPRISIASDGRFYFNKAITEALGIKNGDKVKFAQDEEKPIDWYFQISKKSGFTLIEAKNKTTGFTCSALAKTILKSLNIDDKSAGFLIGGHPVNIGDNQHIYPIITLSYKKKESK